MFAQGAYSKVSGSDKQNPFLQVVRPRVVAYHLNLSARLLFSILCLWACCCHKGQADAGGKSLKIEGVLTYRNEWSNKTRLERYLFRVLTMGDQWNIQMIPHQMERPAILHYEMGFDGDCIYKYDKPNSAGLVSTNGLPLKPINKGICQIIPDHVPNPDGFRSVVLWLAFCSPAYFRTNTAGTARQIWEWAEIPSTIFSNIQVKAAWEWLTPDKAFLSRCTYYQSTPATSLSSRSPTRQKVDLPHVKYQVLASTTFDNRRIPSNVELVRFSEIALEKQTPLEHFAAVVTNIAYAAPLLDPKPSFSAPVIMMDYRYRDENPALDMFQFLETNGVWHSKSVVTNMRNFQVEKRLAPHRTKPARMWISAIFILFVFMSTLGFALVITKLYEHSKNFDNTLDMTGGEKR